MKLDMTQQVYTVPTIPPDLRREETIKQIADALDYLDQVANDVFSKISSRVSENHNRLRTINDRVNTAQAKIDSIKGRNKATKVFSSAKFPSVDTETAYQTVFEDAQKDLKRSSYRLQSKHQPVDDRAMKDKLQYYNVHLNTKKKTKEGSVEEGLGRLPKEIPSVSSLLLFNTTENPYKKYVMLDPLGVVTKTRTALDEEEEGLAAAPSTIMLGEQMQRQQKEDIFYRPDLGEVPEIAAPVNLPDLPGIADDLLWTGDLGTSIAPSLPGSNIPDLPSVLPEPSSEPPPPGAPPESGPPPPPPPGPPPPGPPPPPPPPPPGDAAPPPPPPPPPPAADAGPPPPPPPGDVPAAPSSVPEEVSSAGDGRSSLMDAIRKAGGAGKAKLKSAKERKKDTKKKIQEEKATGGGGGGDLMSSLAAALTMRRKGISGTTKSGAEANKSNADSGGGGGSAMDKISMMIPPPPGDSKDDQEDDDWE